MVFHGFSVLMFFCVCVFREFSWISWISVAFWWLFVDFQAGFLCFSWASVEFRGFGAYVIGFGGFGVELVGVLVGFGLFLCLFRFFCVS